MSEVCAALVSFEWKSFSNFRYNVPFIPIQCTIYPDDSFLVLCKISVFSGHSPFLPSSSVKHVDNCHELIVLNARNSSLLVHLLLLSVADLQGLEESCQEPEEEEEEEEPEAKEQSKGRRLK